MTGAGSRTLLATAHDRVVQLVGSLGRLRDDLAWVEGGGRLLYAVDFSEVHAFLHPERETTDAVQIGLGPGSQSEARVLTRLGLGHLFRTFGDQLHLLPPHTRELDGYLRTFEAKAHRAEGLAAAARAWIDQLDPGERASLERLAQPGDLSDPEREAIAALMQDEASRLCDQVAELTGWLTADTAIGELRALVGAGRLSYRIDASITRCGAPAGALSAPSLDDERRAFQAFPEAIRGRRRAQKMVDARALIALRDANRALAPHGARLLLITRDSSMAAAAAHLAGDGGFAWAAVDQHLRTLDEVVLDLPLQGATDAEQRRSWLADTDELFRGVQGPLRALLAADPTDAAALDRFQVVARRRLRELESLWRRHHQLRLSLAVPRVDWLSTDFLAPAPSGDPSDPDEDPTIPPGDDGAVPKLRQFVRLVSTDAFQQQLRDDLRQLRLDLVAQGLQVLFLGRIGAQRLDRLVAFFGAGWAGEDRDDGTLLRSTRYTAVCSLQFVSDRYRDLVRGLTGWTGDERARYDRLERVFFDLVQENTSQEHAAEGFLFMALALAMLHQWDEALAAAQASVRMPGRMLRHEAHYLMAVVSRRRAAPDPSTRLAFLVEAYNHALSASRTKHRFGGQQDARYLLEQGTAALMWRQLALQHGGVQANRKRSTDTEYHPGWLDRSAAVRTLGDALGLVGDDPRLEVDIRNNLAYAAVSAQPPDLAGARVQADAIEALFTAAAALDAPPMPPQPWPAVRDTLLLVRALEARAAGEAPAVRACLADWDTLLADPNLLDTDRASIRATRAAVRAWPLVADP